MTRLGKHSLEELYDGTPGEVAAVRSADSVDKIKTESPLVIGDDGDDIGQRSKIKFRVDGNGDMERVLASWAPGDLVASGHGFLVRDVGATPKIVAPTECELCSSPILARADDWVCELGAALVDCHCNWCLLKGQWLRGEYRPLGGRPAKRCGTAECRRRAARERQRKSRATRKAALSQKPL